MSVKIGKVELSILEMIFLLIIILGILIFYGAMVNNPDDFSSLAVISLILVVVGFGLFFFINYKKCYIPETAPFKKFGDLATNIEGKKDPEPFVPSSQASVFDEVSTPSVEPKKELFDEDVGDEDLLEDF